MKNLVLKYMLIYQKDHLDYTLGINLSSFTFMICFENKFFFINNQFPIFVSLILYSKGRNQGQD